VYNVRFDQFIVSTNGIPQGVKVTYDKEVFGSMVDFITGLSPDQLNQAQTSKIVDIVSSFNMIPEGEEYAEEDTGDTLIRANKEKMNEWYSQYKEHLDVHRDMNRGRRLI